jgi:hypothetical protein
MLASVRFRRRVIRGGKDGLAELTQEDHLGSDHADPSAGFDLFRYKRSPYGGPVVCG